MIETYTLELPSPRSPRTLLSDGHALRPWSWLVGLLLLLAVGAGPAQAQSLELGLRGGTSFSTFRGNTEVLRRGTAYDLKWRTGVQVAGHVGVPLNDVLRLRPELRFAQKGAIVEGTRPFSPPGTGGDAAIREPYRLSYLQLPVLIEARLPLAERVQASLVLGPSAALTLGTEIDADPASQTETIPESAVRDLAFSASGGLELGYTLGPTGRVTLGTLYDVGLSALTDNDDAAVEQGKEADVRNDAVVVSLGYTYSF